MKGIYPGYLYYKKFNMLILAYCISETNDPGASWNIDNPKTITEYFKENKLGEPYRYGASYVCKVYDTNNLPSADVIDSDLNKLIDFYLNLDTQVKLEIIESSDFKRDAFVSDLKNSGLLFSDTLVSRFISSLLTKPFVILTGLSGSGKTKMAQSFVQWICKDKNQYCLIPVGADWTNREPLLGYPNALKPEEYVKPDNGVLDLIIQANSTPELPYFLILDEMNLSHVERYFADFLSVMESKEEIPLYAKGTVENGVPSKLKLPSNLFIIGTVNIDETTNMFSPKVLDRANTIEFRVDQNEMKDFLVKIKDIDMESLAGQGKGMAGSFLNMALNKEFNTADIEEINAALIQFFGELKKTGAEFGYRSATEILRLIHQLSLLDNNLETSDKIDIAIMQKLLPKLHGSRRKICPVLETLGGFCMSDKTNIIKEVFEKEDFNFNGQGVMYPLSLEKITRMYRGAVDNGFASFAEA
ncbi:MAG: DUF3578 domain-containing protein [Bacteroidetes bacterium HGW-Bacteroidetes-8]|nr:MAG: DUF3578 domain-containing protein [Bacteroidetes bacterium HGW-Bacteroidetes-8]